MADFIEQPMLHVATIQFDTPRKPVWEYHLAHIESTDFPAKHLITGRGATWMHNRRTQYEEHDVRAAYPWVLLIKKSHGKYVYFGSWTTRAKAIYNSRAQATWDGSRRKHGSVTYHMKDEQTAATVITKTPLEVIDEQIQQLAKVLRGNDPKKQIAALEDFAEFKARVEILALMYEGLQQKALTV